ncbi:MAG: hypothetical protein KAG99_05835, partial [Bacteroidales bacterium]|nr:hypothetical protein [Bacteroidales bacterium]
ERIYNARHAYKPIHLDVKSSQPRVKIFDPPKGGQVIRYMNNDMQIEYLICDIRYTKWIKYRSKFDAKIREKVDS